MDVWLVSCIPHDTNSAILAAALGLYINIEKKKTRIFGAIILVQTEEPAPSNIHSFTSPFKVNFNYWSALLRPN